MTPENLESLLTLREKAVKEGEEAPTDKTVAEVLSGYITTSDLDKRIRGLYEVKRNIIQALKKASFVSRQGYIPMILFVGPSASGKTEIVEELRTIYYQTVRDKTPIYTLSISGVECPYRENPYNILRSVIPFKFKLEGVPQTTKKGPEICSVCVKKLEALVSAGKDSKDVMIHKTSPQTANLQLNDEHLADKFYTVVKNANRSFLLVAADKSKISGINPRTYEFLVNLYDNLLSDLQGNHVPLDMLVIINSNEEFLAESNNSDSSAPLKERIIEIQVRRNLSYTEEEKMYHGLNLPLLRTFPNALKYVAITNILSRINDKLIQQKQAKSKPSNSYNAMFENEPKRTTSSDNIRRIHSILTILDLYDTGLLDQSKMTNSIINLLGKGNPYDDVLNMIKEQEKYTSAWESGISFRQVTNQLKTKNGDFNFSDFNNYLEQNATRGLTDEKIQYIEKTVAADIKSKLDYLLLCHNFEVQDKSIDRYTKKTMDYLEWSSVSHDPDEEFDDREELVKKLETYIDVERLKSGYKAYKSDNAPIMGKFEPNFIQFLEYLYLTDERSILKMDEAVQKQLYEKNSDLHKKIKGQMLSRFSFWDESFLEALSVYKNNKLAAASHDY